jgi:hypothetical protein
MQARLLFHLQFCREIGMDRWFADYERRSKHFAGHGERFTLHGLESPEEARRHCEQHANAIGSIASPKPSG